MAIKYPNPTKNNSFKQDNHFKSQGMIFEHSLNVSNEYYRLRNIALIYKKPTPVQIVKVDYPKRSSAKIVEAYYQTPSTTDYNGIYKGKYLDYEAKETVKSFFPFKHIFPHQVEHLEKVQKLGGIAFVIIYFRTFNSVIIINIEDFSNLYHNGDRKSISYEKALEIGKEAKLSYSPPINYLSAVDELFKL